jgi:hypothetical protein
MPVQKEKQISVAEDSIAKKGRFQHTEGSKSRYEGNTNKSICLSFLMICIKRSYASNGQAYAPMELNIVFHL